MNLLLRTHAFGHLDISKLYINSFRPLYVDDSTKLVSLYTRTVDVSTHPFKSTLW